MPKTWRIKALPEKTKALESSIFELKAKLDNETDTFFWARLAASFANSLGGTILIGAAESKKKGHVERYVGIAREEGAAAQKLIADAVATRCSPKMSTLLDWRYFDSPDDPERKVLAVFVDPYVGGQLVGVKVQERELAIKKEAGDTYSGTSWVFPLRTNSENTYADPGELQMFTDAKLRRVFVQLSAIDEENENGEKEFVYVRLTNSHSATSTTFMCKLVRLSAIDNVLSLYVGETSTAPGRPDLEFLAHPTVGREMVFSIDQVRHVQRPHKYWVITVSYE